ENAHQAATEETGQSRRIVREEGHRATAMLAVPQRHGKRLTVIEQGPAETHAQALVEASLEWAAYALENRREKPDQRVQPDGWQQTIDTAGQQNIVDELFLHQRQAQVEWNR